MNMSVLFGFTFEDVLDPNVPEWDPNGKLLLLQCGDTPEIVFASEGRLATTFGAEYFPWDPDRLLQMHTQLAKDLLDEGRVRFLREHAGFEDARLVTYVDGAITPENVLIVASRGQV